VTWRVLSMTCIVVGLGWPAESYAQHPSGEIRVEVVDPSGAGMQASGTLQSLGTGVVRPFETDARGSYTFAPVPLGRYRLYLSREGFAEQSLLVDVESSTPVSRKITMAIGAASATVDVVATTPLPGSDLPVRQTPAAIQTGTERDIENSAAMDLSDFLNRRLSGVNINENQGNPFQPDVSYRGYTASPLLGTPQGLSVYLDGVRLNQPFGDVVSWDLIPRLAISDVAVVPGSNPLFGLNTLGGAVSVETKDGRQTPGASVALNAGSFGRRLVEGEYGGVRASGFNWYVTGDLLHENGWRVASPSDVRQVFSKIGWQGATTALELTSAYSDNSLSGNGLQEQRFLARDYASAYTLGDVTTNRSPFFNLRVRHAGTSALTFSANAYVRYLRTDTINPNLNTNSLDEAVYQPTAADQAALTAAGYTGFPASGANASNTPFPYWRCLAQALQKDEPLEKCNGVIINGETTQYNYGFSGQTTWTTAPGGHRQQLTAGAAWDRSTVTFEQSTQFAYINPDYTLTPVNAFEDGSTNHNGDPVDTRVNLRGVPQTWSLYATDVLSLGTAWSLNVSGRYNRIGIANDDRLNPGGGSGSLSGHYVFQRFNPAAGLTFSPSTDMTAYAGYGEGSRAPTAIELGCADPANPCNLPNALVSDPPLRQVVTRTVEAGLRGNWRDTITWSVAWFWAQNHDDLLFVASPQTGNGYFKNFGETRRTGLETHLSGRIGRVMLGGNYTLLNATYQSPEAIGGSANSANDAALSGAPGLDGLIRIQPGDTIPLIPQHLLKAYVDLQATDKLSIDLGGVAASRALARGNENNLSQPDGRYYLGPGTSPAYAVVNAGVRYRVRRGVQLFAQINNLFDHHYYTAAQLGPTGFTDQGTFIARPFPAVKGSFPIVHATFYAPGALIGAWGGLRLTF
jgi:outer membrane receptor protein involved in Fe transport